MQTLVIQSYRTQQVPAWIRQCLHSVRRWAQSNHYDYRFIGDEIFTLVPDWYREKAADKLPVCTDFARLVLLQEGLLAGYEQVVWLDADLLVFDQALSLDFTASCAFGREYWVQQNGNGRLRLHRNVHNAVCVFRRDCPVLPFLLHCVESIMRRADPEHIAPQMVGPKLLGALHTLAGFSLLENIGAFSPLVTAELAGQGDGKALVRQRQAQTVPLQAVNLCASLITPDLAESACNRLLTDGFAGGC